MKPMKPSILLFISSFIILLIYSSCQSGFELKEGDFLFQDLDCGSMCDAIEEVTQGIDGARLSHVGLVVVKNDSFKVTEAISAGVVFTPLNDFINRSQDSEGNPKILVGRLKSEYIHLTTKAIAYLNSYLNAPYDDYYKMNNDSFYCSELLYTIYKEANNGDDVFSLFPMTFKQPGSEIFYPVWEKYYNNLGCTIPEDELGCNPGGISRSQYIEIVHAYGKPDGWEGQ